MKILIYSSKDIYDKASYIGRAEADIVVYGHDDFYYTVVKDLKGLCYGIKKVRKRELARSLKVYERNNKLDIPQVPV